MLQTIKRRHCLSQKHIIDIDRVLNISLHFLDQRLRAGLPLPTLLGFYSLSRSLFELDFFGS